MEKRKLGIPDLIKMKKERRKIVLLSVPDATTARLAERAGVDVVCLGDSLGMVALGYPSTVPVTMDDMVRHGKAVRRGAPNTFLLACMPYGSYRTPKIAVENALRFMQEVGADAVKPQGGTRIVPVIRAIADAGIPCMSHVGLVPHTIALLGGFIAQGRTAESAKQIYEDALAIQDAGAVGIEIEAIPPKVAERITNDVDILTYGIGAGASCDGQILIAWDMLGFFDEFKPKFVKRYAALAETVLSAISEFTDEVRASVFPASEHTYSMPDEEWNRFEAMLGSGK